MKKFIVKALGVAGRILSKLFSMLRVIAFILFLALLATFFITIFMPDQVLRAVEIFKGIL